MTYGSSGLEVTNLQNALNRSGTGINIVADGQFGPGTLAAVKKFQTAKGLPVTGLVDDKTKAALNLQSVAIFETGNSNKFFDMFGGKTMAITLIGGTVLIAMAFAINNIQQKKSS